MAILRPVEISLNAGNLQSKNYNHPSMRITVRSFAKINLGLCIGPSRSYADKSVRATFHELRTVYQTIALHDVLHLEVMRGTGIEIRCADPRVPTDESNTCYGVLERSMAALKAKGRVVLEIEKRLPVQGGLGGASGNAVAAMIALERALKKNLGGPQRLRIAAEVGSDLPLFLLGGTSLGVSHGEEVYPLADLPATPCVIATPEIGVSTPKAFADWDALMAQGETAAELSSARTGGGARPYVGLGDANDLGLVSRTSPATDPRSGSGTPKLTSGAPSDRIVEFGRTLSVWLSGFPQKKTSRRSSSGVPAKGRGRAETLLLDLVRTGIENDFETVVFPQYPALREVKRVLEGSGAFYASLSGSGSALYGLYRTRAQAEKAAHGLKRAGIPATATTTLTRSQYWKKLSI
jgi:4-diphosphocytidyl-2-C-methyl-D-erythritol kinase